MTKRLDKDEMRELLMNNCSTLMFDEKWLSKVALSGEIKKNVTVDYGKMVGEALDRIENMSKEEFENECVKAGYVPKDIEREARQHIIDSANDNVKWEFKPFIIPLDTLNMTKEEKDLYLNGGWKVEPLNAIVLYTKGDLKSKQCIYGKEGVHYVNTKYGDVQDVVLGHRYNHLVIVDDGVAQEDIDVAQKYVISL